jgi:hypothetical protein
MGLLHQGGFKSIIARKEQIVNLVLLISYLLILLYVETRMQGQPG